jgi:hypothetical protein
MPALAVLIFSITATFLSAQQATPVSATISSQPHVSIAFTARDRTKTFVRPVSREQIKVKVAGREISDYEVTDIAASPLQVCIVLDNSGSSQLEARAIDGVFRGAMALLKINFRKGRDLACATSFDESFHIDQDWTDDLSSLATAAQQDFKPHGRSAIYDGALATCEHFEQSAVLAPRRVILLGTDGIENASKHSLKDTIRTCQMHRVAIFILNTYPGNTFPVMDGGDSAMSALAHSTGGEYYSPASDKEMIAAYEDIVSRVGAMQQLSVSAPLDQTTKIDLKASTKGWSVSAPRAVVLRK